MKNTPRHWFKRRRYGYGWMPTAWQGWLVILSYIIFVLLLSLFLGTKGNEPSGAELLLFFALFAIATAGLIVISYIKGPRPKWRWKSTESDNPDEDY